MLPGPNADVWAWQMHGRCRGLDSAFFFPVIAQCRTHALTMSESFGVWGGLSSAQRRRLVKDQNHCRTEDLNDREGATSIISSSRRSGLTRPQ